MYCGFVHDASLESGSLDFEAHLSPTRIERYLGGLGELGPGAHQGQGRPHGSMSAYRGTYRSPTNKVLTSAAGVDESDGAKKLRELMRFWFGVHVDVDDERDESVEGDDVSRGDGGGGYVWGREMEVMKMEAGKVMKMEGDGVSRGDGGSSCVRRREMEAMKMEARRVIIPNLIIGTRGIELEF
ncbi:hypothetical protein PIB30_008697 [Stylosanthes scabra]|uniref:Uncharacterized protein n=1 Tax=Stylosanthes scabra TaxID=79078 RepID=A0ABU6T4V9_9FABA|nr:hypothetical protein [Stylosanthes scabra]